MLVGQLKSERRYRPTKIQQYGIVSFGDNNDYPQRVREIVGASVTGSSCLNTYRRFIKGKGTGDAIFDRLLDVVSLDYALFGGFALLVNYNLRYEPISIERIPFDNLRLLEDGNGVAVHPDWNRRLTSVRQWSADDIVRVPFFDKNTVKAQIEEVGGIANYGGQCFYYSNRGRLCYPLPIFDSALTDMSTEEAVSDITHRNAKNGFLPSGLLVNIADDVDTLDDSTEAMVAELQGSKNANKVAYCQVRSEEEIPRFVSIHGDNYDKDYTVSRDAVKDSIGRAFNQPSILRSENVGSGFGAELIQQSYALYNANTQDERNIIQRAYFEIFAEHVSISSLSFDVPYNKTDVVAVLTNISLTKEQKTAVLTVMYGMNEEEVKKLLQ